MQITYKDINTIDTKQLQNLFASVEWDSANYPEKLTQAIKNSDSVITAWNGSELVGLMNALSDGVMTAYFHYLLVKPQYHKMNIGRTLVEKMLQKYSEYARKVVIAYEKEAHFYEQCGFNLGKGAVPMFITYLTT